MKLNPFRLSKEERMQIDALVERRSVTFQDVWGTGNDIARRAAPLTMEGAMGLSPIYAASSLIADTICTFPLESFRTIKGETTKMDPANKLVDSPSAVVSQIAWVHACIISLALRGNAYGYITDWDTFGYPKSIEWLHPDEVSIGLNRTDTPIQWYWKGKKIDTSRMIHIPYYTVPGRVLGISPIMAQTMHIQSGLLAQKFGRDFFQNSSIPSGILTTEQHLKPEDAKIASDRFSRQSRGRGTAVLGHGIVYKPISIAPEESQFLATLKLTATQIAAVYHLPAEMIGGETSGSMTYSNVDGWPITISRFALMPYIVRIEEAMERATPGGQSARFNMDAFQRPDLAARTAAYDLALKDRWMKVDEVRQLENLKPLGGKDGGLLALPTAAPVKAVEPPTVPPKEDSKPQDSQDPQKKIPKSGKNELPDGGDEKRKTPRQLAAELRLRMVKERWGEDG